MLWNVLHKLWFRRWSIYASKIVLTLISQIIITDFYNMLEFPPRKVYCLYTFFNRYTVKKKIQWTLFIWILMGSAKAAHIMGMFIIKRDWEMHYNYCIITTMYWVYRQYKIFSLVSHANVQWQSKFSHFCTIPHLICFLNYNPFFYNSR